MKCFNHAQLRWSASGCLFFATAQEVRHSAFPGRQDMLRSIPLALTLFRLALIPAFAWLFHSEMGAGVRLPGLLVLIIAGIVSDWADGYLARRLGVVSVVGKLLDPLTDAAFCMAIFVVYARAELIPWWVVAVLIGRETAMTLIVRPFCLWRGTVVAARMIGKVKTSFQFGLMITVVVAQLPEGLPLVLQGLRWLANFLLVPGYFIVLGLSVTSLWYYLVDLRAMLAKERKEG